MAHYRSLRSSLNLALVALSFMTISFTASASEHSVKFTIFVESSDAYSPILAVLPEAPVVVTKRQDAAVPLIDVLEPAMKPAVFASMNVGADERHYRRLRYESS